MNSKLNKSLLMNWVVLLAGVSSEVQLWDFIIVPTPVLSANYYNFRLDLTLVKCCVGGQCHISDVCEFADTAKWQLLL